MPPSRSDLWHIKLKKSDLKEGGGEQESAADAGVESGFYYHKSLL